MIERRHHDMGGLPAGKVEPTEHDYPDWERRVDAMVQLLRGGGRITVDELRKNIEALTQANQLAVEGVQAVVRRQVEITRQAVEEFTSMFRDFVQPSGSPEDRLAKQAEYSKQALQKGLTNARELTELLTKSHLDSGMAPSWVLRRTKY